MAGLFCVERDSVPVQNVDLTEHFDEFISDGVKAGRYSDASEVIRAGLRLLEQQEQEDEAKIEWLRATTREAFEALDRGEGITLDSSDDIDSFINEIAAEARGERLGIHA
jgi:antitoxin ParD1/3/4